MFNIEHLKYFVTLPSEHQTWKIHNWVSEYDPSDYMILHNCFTPADGQWHNSTTNTPVCVAFRNDEDAMAFKLRWL